MTIWLDMDGTMADLYGVDGWLPMLVAHDETPYAVAKPLVRMATLARLLNNRQREGWRVAVVSALAKNSNAEYDERVKLAKLNWLAKHLPSVQWAEIKIVAYGTNKRETCGDGILFDDEERNRNEWGEGAYTPDEIIHVLSSLLA